MGAKKINFIDLAINLATIPIEYTRNKEKMAYFTLKARKIAILNRTIYVHVVSSLPKAFDVHRARSLRNKRRNIR